MPLSPSGQRETVLEYPLRWEAPTDEPHLYDWVPNTTDRTNLPDLDVVPLDKDEPWETIRLLAGVFYPTLILGLFPAFSQYDIRFHRAIRSLPYPMPVSNIAEERARVAVALIDPVHVDAVVTMRQGFKNFQRELGEHPARERLYYQIVLGLGEMPDTPPGKGRLFYEVHAVPSMVVLYQCEHVQKESKAHVFHTNTRFTWEFEGQNAFMTDLEKGRFMRVLLPYRLERLDTRCSCNHPDSLALVL